MSWKIKQIKSLNLKDPILISGLPGIGNVGKIAVDFVIDNLNAEKVFEVDSYHFPHCVFVNEDNLVELPAIEIFHKKLKNRDFLFLAGDIQPLDERSCYEFCDQILDLFEKIKGKEIITLGGVALDKIPEEPSIYCTGNDKKIIKEYEPKENNVESLIGPIVGVTGLLIGLAGKRKIKGVTLLAETFGHPNFLGIKSARKLLTHLNEKLKLKIKLNELDAEIKEIERDLSKNIKPKLKSKALKSTFVKDTNYIG